VLGAVAGVVVVVTLAREAWRRHRAMARAAMRHKIDPGGTQRMGSMASPAELTSPSVYAAAAAVPNPPALHSTPTKQHEIAEASASGSLISASTHRRSHLMSTESLEESSSKAVRDAPPTMRGKRAQHKIAEASASGSLISASTYHRSHLMSTESLKESSINAVRDAPPTMGGEKGPLTKQREVDVAPTLRIADAAQYASPSLSARFTAFFEGFEEEQAKKEMAPETPATQSVNPSEDLQEKMRREHAAEVLQMAHRRRRTAPMPNKSVAVPASAATEEGAGGSFMMSLVELSHRLSLLDTQDEPLRAGEEERDSDIFLALV
jgi:hypothetical protein